MPMLQPKYTIFVVLNARPDWLRLPRDERNQIVEAALLVALQDMPVTYRHFDAEAFSGFCSDVAVFEAHDMMAFYVVMERLRDSVIFGQPYFDLVQIVPAVEDGYRLFERMAVGQRRDEPTPV